MIGPSGTAPLAQHPHNPGTQEELEEQQCFLALAKESKLGSQSTDGLGLTEKHKEEIQLFESCGP